jgi:hypothetical protein
MKAERHLFCTNSTITDIGINTAHIEWTKIPIKAIKDPKISVLLDVGFNTKYEKCNIMHAREMEKIASGAQYELLFKGAQIIKNGLTAAATSPAVPMRVMYRKSTQHTKELAICTEMSHGK